jgi:hypothetical protein
VLARTMPRPASTSRMTELASVAFHRDARFGGDGGEDALEDAVILRVVLAAESDEWLGSYLSISRGCRGSRLRRPSR